MRSADSGMRRELGKESEELFAGLLSLARIAPAAGGNDVVDEIAPATDERNILIPAQRPGASAVSAASLEQGSLGLGPPFLDRVVADCALSPRAVARL